MWCLLENSWGLFCTQNSDFHISRTGGTEVEVYYFHMCYRLQVQGIQGGCRKILAHTGLPAQRGFVIVLFH